MKPTPDNPRLTTRRIDGFTEFEAVVLAAAEVEDIWLVTGQTENFRHYMDAAWALTRWGYLKPTQEGKPDISGSWGFRITETGRDALDIWNALKANQGVAA